MQDFKYYITTITDSNGNIVAYSYGEKSDNPLIANISIGLSAINTLLYKENEKDNYLELIQILIVSPVAELLVDLCENFCGMD